MTIDLKPLNEVVYTGADYPSLVDRLMRRAKSTLTPEEYNDYVAAAVGQMLIELMGFSQAQGVWYTNRMVSELYLRSARTREGVSRICEQNGYMMRPAASASTEVVMTFGFALPSDYTVLAPFQFRADNGRLFEIIGSPTFTAGSTTATVSVREGETRRLTFVSRGTKMQEFRLSSIREGEFLSSESVVVFVDGVAWSESRFLTFDKTNQFQVGYQDEPPTIRFGDGFAGNIPPSGASIETAFFATHGASGGVTSGRIKSAITPLVVAGMIVPVTVTNPAGASGGDDPESIESAKVNAPRYFPARNSAITLPDYLAHVATFVDPQYGAVAKGWAACVRNSVNDPGTVSRVGELTDAADSVSTEILGFSALAQASVSSASDSAGLIVAGVASVNAANADALSQSSAAKAQAELSIAQVVEAEASRQRLVALLADTYSATSTVPEPLRSTIRALVSQCQVIASVMQSNLTAAQLASSVVVSTANAIAQDSALITAGTLAQSANAAAAQVSLASASSALDSLELIAADYPVAVQSIAGVLLTYLSGLFSEDCKANVVTVPILTKDSDGFYAAPSEGLVRRLQAYLDTICDVTHLVSVVSGVSSLVPANIRVRFKVMPTAVPATVLTGIQSAIDDMLRSMDFSDRLNLDDIYRLIRERVDGIEWMNVVITGPTSRLDADGNLVPLATEIVTKGTVTLEEL